MKPFNWTAQIGGWFLGNTCPHGQIGCQGDFAVMLPVRAGERPSRALAPGVVLYTAFCCCSHLLPPIPSCYGHLASVIWQYPPCESHRVGTSVASVWWKQQRLLIHKTVWAMLGLVCMPALGVGCCFLASDSQLKTIQGFIYWERSQNACSSIVLWYNNVCLDKWTW